MNRDDRVHSLDWLRVVGTLCVFLFHMCQFFHYGDWSIKNETRSEAIDTLSAIIIQWLMPLFFLISGAGSWMALRRQTVRQYVADRSMRLLVPLVFAVFVLSPPQVYLERLSHGEFTGSFIAFMPEYFHGMYGFGGNFAWMGLHLWYVMLLWILSVITLPLLAGHDLRGPKWDGLSRLIAKPGGFLLLAIPLTLVESLLDPEGLGNRRTGGWSPFVYLVYFLLGYAFVHRAEVRNAFTRQWKAAAALAFIVPAVVIALDVDTDAAIYPSAPWVLLDLLRNVNAMAWIVMLFGIAGSLPRFGNRLPPRVGEAVMPFYMLHQPVLIIVGYFVVQTEMGIAGKFIAIAAISFAVIAGLCALIIGGGGIPRILFGLKPRTIRHLPGDISVRRIE